MQGVIDLKRLLVAVIVFMVGSVAVPANAITIEEISPNSGDLEGGTEITIVGTEFEDETEVFLGEAACENVEIVSDTVLTCISTPYQSGVVDVFVSSENSSTTLGKGFMYRIAATYSSIKKNIFPKCDRCHAWTYEKLFDRNVIVPEYPEQSKLYHYVRTGRMPRGGEPLSDSDVRAIYDWISAGAIDN